MENLVIAELIGAQSVLAFRDVTPVKVSLSQFHGIEINDFAVSVAQTALWIAELQANIETQSIVLNADDPLPLVDTANIHLGNALRMDWNDVLPAEQCDYIFGNPPFLGHSWRSPAQQEDMSLVFRGVPKAGKLDYVAAWYLKAAMYMNDKSRAAFVSTNSITQGEQTAILWKHLFGLGISINFAVTTFVWGSESTDVAHVHVVIIGFSYGHPGSRFLITSDVPEPVQNINGYLVDQPNLFIRSRGLPLNADAEPMTQGSKPVDSGHLVVSEDERLWFLDRYPELDPLIRPYVGSREFIRGRPRYCFWLKGVAPGAYQHVPELLSRLAKVREERLKSPTKAFRDSADRPMEFTENRQPHTQYLAVPEVSSERRRYIPAGFLESEVIASNKLYIVPDADRYVFGLVSSRMHNAWMRVVAGRLKSDYSYSPAVYNTFIWPTVTEHQRQEIADLAQDILVARAKYSGSTLAQLYDPDTAFLFPELTAAHEALDAAVERAYGLQPWLDEKDLVAHLFELYRATVGKG